MKKLIFLFVAVAMGLVCACGGKGNGQTGYHHPEIVVKDSVSISRVQSMPESKKENAVVFKGRSYSSLIHRQPDAELPRVSDESGDSFMDNKIIVRLSCDSKVVFNRTFTKTDFMSVVSPDFLRKAILEGVVFDRVSDEGFVYAASVSYPQTDLYVPIAIVISLDGKMRIEKVDKMEEEL
ncbi:MAG: DUF4738 domain-containing protein [Bacteroidia bacterium]|nr:DUF4738 domain-containing protein [Bacteroidia bacterium]